MKKKDIISQLNYNPAPMVDFPEFAPASFAEWKNAAISGLKGAPFEKVLQRKTLDGLLLEAIYDADVTSVSDTVAEACIRGRQSAQPWGIGQIFQTADAASLCRELEKALVRGQNEVRVILSTPDDVDLASRDDTGLSITDLSSFSDAIPKRAIHFPVRMHGRSRGIATLAFWRALCETRGWDMAEWVGSIGFSPLSELAYSGKLPGNLETVFDEAFELVSWMAPNTPNARALLIDGTRYHNAGATPAIEMACCLTEAAEYMKALVTRGLTATDVASTISIQVATGDDFFEDIAKMRGLRLLFAGLARLMGCKKAPVVELWSRTSRFFTSTDEPLTNVLRTFTATLSGALGGAQSIHAAPFNEIYGESDRLSDRIARNIQLILQQECHVGEVQDACGGAYYIEHLTDRLAEAAWTQFQQLMSHTGGYPGALSDGHVASLMQQGYEARLQLLNRRKLRMVGVNDFVAFDSADIELKRNTGKKSPVDRVTMNAQNWEGHFEKGTMVDGATSAVLKGASLFAVDSLVKGEGHSSAQAIGEHRLALGYEQLRNDIAALNCRRETPCTVVLLRLGTVRESKARADFSRGFFNAAGFRIIESQLCSDVAGARQAAMTAGADITVFCSTDERYAEWAAELAREIRKVVKTILVLAGRPGAQESSYRESGISEFVFLGADHYALLTSFANSLAVETGENHG